MSAFNELELGIDDLETETAEGAIRTVLKGLQGIHAARLVRGGGVHVIYNPLGITAEEIYGAVSRAGFTIDTSQKTGEL